MTGALLFAYLILSGNADAPLIKWSPRYVSLETCETARARDDREWFASTSTCVAVLE